MVSAHVRGSLPGAWGVAVGRMWVLRWARWGCPLSFATLLVCSGSIGRGGPVLLACKHTPSKAHT